jgi:hypothetical protein
LFTYTKLIDAFNAWLSRKISNFDYLLLLNSFSCRSFSDLAQYPVFPWVSSPDLEPRDLSLPMGQLSETRARHFQDTYHDSKPKYFYGCHYSLPGAVFWFLMRIPPFSFFLWDLNDGWDDQGRMFTSIGDCWASASQLNQTDLKEPIAELFALPEMFVNPAALPLPKECVTLPEWTLSSPHLFVAMMRKALEECESLQDWVDLVFGFKQTGDAAVLAKNVFLPTSYHSCTAQAIELEEQAFEDQVLNFGQCPEQLFQRHHPPRDEWEHVDVRQLETHIAVEGNAVSPRAASVPAGGCASPPEYDYYVIPEVDGIAIKRFADGTRTGFKIVGHVTTCQVSVEGTFVAGTFYNGKVVIYELVHENKVPSDLMVVRRFSFAEESIGSAILSQDFLVATAFADKIVVNNFATGLLHRQIECTESPKALFFDAFEGILSVAFGKKVCQFSVNGEKLHEIAFDSQVKAICLVPYDFRFDGRLLVVGDESGSVSFCIVIESFELKKIFETRLHERPCAALHFDENKGILYSSDDRGTWMTVNFDWNARRAVLLTKCQFCQNGMTARCQKCRAPLCDDCPAGNLCPNCGNSENLFVFPRW